LGFLFSGVGIEGMGDKQSGSNQIEETKENEIKITTHATKSEI